MSVSCAGVSWKQQQQTFLSSLGLTKWQVVSEKLPKATTASIGQPVSTQSQEEKVVLKHSLSP